MERSISYHDFESEAAAWCEQWQQAPGMVADWEWSVARSSEGGNSMVGEVRRTLPELLLQTVACRPLVYMLGCVSISHTLKHQAR